VARAIGPAEQRDFESQSSALPSKQRLIHRNDDALHRLGVAVAERVAFAVLGAGAAGAQEPALSAPRFAALDSVYKMNAMLGHAPSAAAIADARGVCDALDRSDRLLAVTRTACLTQLKDSPAFDGFAGCPTLRGCRRVIGRSGIVISQLLVDVRASNKVVASSWRPADVAPS
jgi:hypothetical protein